jgi:hypothetical protein
MRRILTAALLLCALVLPAVAQEPAAPPQQNVVEGLKLSPNVTVPPGKLVRVTATCDGPVSFLILPSADFAVEAEEEPEQKRVLVVAPEDSQAVLVIAVGFVEGKPTPFARSYILSAKAGPGGEDDPGKKPRPPPKPDPVKPLPVGKLHVTLVLDYATLAPPAATLANSPSLHKSLADAGHALHVLAATAPEVAARRLDRFVKEAGGPAVVVVQDEKGKVLRAVRLPGTEAELLALILGK